MPLPRSHAKKLDLRITIPGVSPWNSVINMNHNGHSNRQTTVMSNGYQYDLTLNDHEARAVRGEGTECFDELDLVSECSSPSSYTPGKYLQLCDLDPSEVVDSATLFPESFQSPGNDFVEVPLISNQNQRHKLFQDRPSFREVSYESSRSQLLPFVSNKTLIVVALCVVLAFTALGGLATVI